MISKITGKVDNIYSDSVIIDVNGIGYKISCSKRVINALTTSQIATFFVSTQIKEQYIELFGFEDDITKKIFLILQSVSGVGAKMAMAFMDIYSCEEIKDIILSKQIDLLRKISGVGPKLAQRIIIELYEKIKKMPSPIGIITNTCKYNNYVEDAISVLIKLGIPQIEAKTRIENAQNKLSKILSTEELVKIALQ